MVHWKSFNSDIGINSWVRSVPSLTQTFQRRTRLRLPRCARTFIPDTSLATYFRDDTAANSVVISISNFGLEK